VRTRARSFPANFPDWIAAVQSPIWSSSPVHFHSFASCAELGVVAKAKPSINASGATTTQRRRANGMCPSYTPMERR
jgi:hypothetical protein